VKTFLISILFLLNVECPNPVFDSQIKVDEIEPGANQIGEYLPLLIDKNVGLVVNHTSNIDKTHIVDSLSALGVRITKIFTPEHGYRGTADAGEHIENEIKESTSIISLYGKRKKPSPEDLNNVDIILFDIQDVGVRFYTYISTLHYVMEAAAENAIPMILLDRPNPNGFYVDGPVLKPEFSSFVGMHPVPVVYGLTIGEYANMINGEKWLNDGIQTELITIPCRGYNHQISCKLPVKPSPNLPNYRSILLYPSLCFFEGTHLNVGRGTDNQFQIIGHPDLANKFDFSFTPKSREGAKYPKHQNEECYGIDLTQIKTENLIDHQGIDMSYLIELYGHFQSIGSKFFIDNNFFDKLAGSDVLKSQIIGGFTEEEIRNSWKEDLINYSKIREKYLLYSDF